MWPIYIGDNLPTLFAFNVPCSEMELKFKLPWRGEFGWGLIRSCAYSSGNRDHWWLHWTIKAINVVFSVWTTVVVSFSLASLLFHRFLQPCAFSLGLFPSHDLGTYLERTWTQCIWGQGKAQVLHMVGSEGEEERITRRKGRRMGGREWRFYFVLRDQYVILSQGCGTSVESLLCEYIYLGMYYLQILLRGSWLRLYSDFWN